MSRDHHDSLIEQLLRESLGGDRPRDLTPRVIALAKAYDRTRRSWWISAGAAVAAAIAIVVGVITLWPRSYPAPVADNLLVFGSDLTPGTRLTSTEKGNGRLVLGGGFVDITVGPETSFTLAGEGKYREKILLEDGHLDVSVAKKKGSFVVGVESAAVKVIGTKFSVDVADDIDDTQQLVVKKLKVVVDEGSVSVVGTEAGDATLYKGQQGTFTVSTDVLPRRVEQLEKKIERQEARQERKNEPATLPAAVESAALPDDIETAAFPNDSEANAPLEPLTPTTLTGPVPATVAAATRNAAAASPGRAGRGGTVPNTLKAANARPPMSPLANVDGPRFAQIMIVQGPGPFEFYGILRHLGAYDVLQTQRGYILLGAPDSMPRDTPKPGPLTYVHVTFGGGKVSKIEGIKYLPTMRAPRTQ